VCVYISTLDEINLLEEFRRAAFKKKKLKKSTFGEFNFFENLGENFMNFKFLISRIGLCR